MLVVTPPGLHGVHLVQRPYEAITIPTTLIPDANGNPNGGWTRNAEGVAWEFVVTRRGATSVDSDTMATTTKASGSPEVLAGRWRSTGTGQMYGWSRCGGEVRDWGAVGGGLGGSIYGWRGPEIYFVSACGRK